jgi:L-threonylcarbamoyladenylate synthase
MAQDVSDRLLKQAVDCVLCGGVLLYPTDTVYGLGGDATNVAASERIRKLKGTDSDKPLLLLTDSWTRVEGWIRDPDPLTSALMELGKQYPLTILFAAGPSAPRNITGSSSEIGIRWCHLPFCRRLISESETLISSTSANPTGYPTPVRLDDIDPAIRVGADVEIDGGLLDGLASTIVRSGGGRLEVLREGALDARKIAKLLA